MNKTAKPKLIREINRKSILKVIRHEKITTKTRIYELTKISKQTIGKIVSSLIKENLIHETGYGNSTNEGGKKPLLLKFNENAYYLIGLIIESHQIQCGVTNLIGEIIGQKFIEIQRDLGPEKIIKEMVHIINEVINNSKIDRAKLLGIGIGVPGIVDFEKGLVKVLPLFKGWENVPLEKYINEIFKIPVIIDNENRMRAVGEKWFGMAKNVHNFITIVTGDGIGSGIVINDEVIRGNNLISGEIGHMKLKEDAPLCACGSRGCLETLINTKSINNFLNEIKENNKFNDSNLLKKYRINKTVTLKDVFSEFNKKDKLSELILSKILHWLSIGLSNIVCIFDPELIIIHGDYCELNESFFRDLENAVNENIFPKIKKTIKILKSKMDKDIGIVGSSSIVLDKIYL